MNSYEEWTRSEVARLKAEAEKALAEADVLQRNFDNWLESHGHKSESKTLKKTEENHSFNGHSTRRTKRGAYGNKNATAPEKIKGSPNEGEKRYSPAKCTGAIKHRVEGNPDRKHVSTSYAERQNLNMRMGMRRFTRLTNAFSKKYENHVHAVAIYFMHCNFVRIHQTLKITPAMAAGVTGKL